jgi:hypothetical protein
MWCSVFCYVKTKTCCYVLELVARWWPEQYVAFMWFNENNQLQVRYLLFWLLFDGFKNTWCIYHVPYYVMNGYEHKRHICYICYYVRYEFEKSDVFIMWWINLKISEVCFVGFYVKNLKILVIMWWNEKNHKFAAVILRNGWHTGKRMMSLLLMGGRVKWSFPLSTDTVTWGNGWNGLDIKEV